MLKITGNKGFHMRFANGWTASVQWGPGNYCDNRDEDFMDAEAVAASGSRTAEVAAWSGTKGLVELPGGDTVMGYQSSAQVLEFLRWVAAQPADNNEQDDGIGKRGQDR